MKTILLITYYWPPAGGGGVQRWLKFAKYLPDFGWRPIVYAPENADYPLVDASRLHEIPRDLEVIRRPIVEPRRLYGMVAGDSDRRSEEADEIFHRAPQQRSWKQNVAVWLRGNLLIPDARVLWVRPSVKFLAAWLENQPVDAIVTTGPPHSMHLIGQRLRHRLGIPWIADFRDPWTEIEFFGDMQLSKRSETRHRIMERDVLQRADVVVTVSPTWADRFKDRCTQVAVITNGYDEADFVDRPTPEFDRFRITHVGSLSLDRNPTSLWKALGRETAASPEMAAQLEIELLGRVDPGAIQSAEAAGLGDNLRPRGYVSHREALSAMSRSSAQLLLINKDAANAPGRIPGKLFEYLAAGRPILLIGPTSGDAAEIVKETGAGEVYDYEDSAGIASILRSWYTMFKNQDLSSRPRDAAAAFSHRELTGKLAGILDSVIASSD